MAKNTDFTYEVIEDFGTLSENGDWSKRLRKVKWGENAETFDVRSWNESGDKVKISKGITFTGEELKVLAKLIKEAL